MWLGWCALAPLWSTRLPLGYPSGLFPRVSPGTLARFQIGMHGHERWWADCKPEGLQLGCSCLGYWKSWFCWVSPAMLVSGTAMDFPFLIRRKGFGWAPSVLGCSMSAGPVVWHTAGSVSLGHDSALMSSLLAVIPLLARSLLEVAAQPAPVLEGF